MGCADFADSKLVLEASGLFSGDGLLQPVTRNIPQTEDVSVDLLTGFESIWEDVNDCLTISRMVSNSVINGVVNAVSQEAAELVANKEAEVVQLKENIKELLLEQQLQGDIEKIVIRNVLQSPREEYETKLGDQNVHFLGTSRMHEVEELSGLRKHLDAIQKSLSSLDVAPLSHGSLETDHLHLKWSNHVSPTSADEFNISLPENRESSPLSHLKIDELYNHFRTKLNKMKRDHESAIQSMTEDFFCRKRELLKERGSCFPFKKEKDFELLRKKIPEVIVQLDEILLDNKDISQVCDVSRHKLESLIAENQRLRDVVAAQSVMCLTSELSDASKVLPQHFLVDAKLNEVIGDLKSCVKDTQIEASVSDEVCRCYLKELLFQIGSDLEESNAKSAIAQEFMEIMYKQTAHNMAAALKCDFGDDSDFESIVLQGFSGFVFEEVLKDVGMELKSFNKKCLQESELVESLKCNKLEIERSLAKEAEENSKLKHEIAMLKASVEDKDKLVADLTNTLEKCLKKTASYNEEVALLKEKLESVEKEHRESALRERNNLLLLAEAKDKEHRKQIESTIHYTRGLFEEFAKFELIVLEKIKWNSLRLENSTGQLNSLNQKVRMLRRTELLWKQRLEKRVSDLRKAEAEVDLLGDEVDTLSSLWEKIYLALDHYSPVLRHYPGIMEILNLARRELSGESVKSMYPSRRLDTQLHECNV